MRPPQARQGFSLPHPAKFFGLLALAATLVACVPGVSAQPSDASLTQGSVVSGDVGEKGDQGLPGLAGEQGADGQEGVRGLQGIQGLQGIPGPAGRPGSAGPAGAAGERGIPGPSTPSRAFAFQLRPNIQCEPRPEGDLDPNDNCSGVDLIFVEWTPDPNSDSHIAQLIIPLTLPEGSWRVSATLTLLPGDFEPLCVIVTENPSLEYLGGTDIFDSAVAFLYFIGSDLLSFVRGDGHGLTTLDREQEIYLTCIAFSGLNPVDLGDYAWTTVSIDFYAVELASISYAPSLPGPNS
jgi:hypothetical protein